MYLKISGLVSLLRRMYLIFKGLFAAVLESITCGSVRFDCASASGGLFLCNCEDCFWQVIDFASVVAKKRLSFARI
jgi:hypothetical protein